MFSSYLSKCSIGGRLFLFVFLHLSCAFSEAAILRVKSGATGGANGATWVDAYPNVQDALVAATPGDDLWVAAGIYKPDQGGGMTVGDQAASFIMKDGVKIFGGFSGTETSFAQRDIDANETIFSGDLLGDDSLTGDDWKQSNPSNASDNSYHVMKALAGVSSTAALNGLTIRSGNSEGDAVLSQKGGGLLIEQGASPIIKRCRFEHNRAGARGGGASYLGGGQAQFIRCVFFKNYAQYGGALYISGSSPDIRHCKFDESVTASGTNGGVIVITGASSPVFTNCLFQGGESASGGGIYNESTLQPELINCTMRQNSANRGGGIYSVSTTATMKLSNTIIWGNVDALEGGSTTLKASVAYGSGALPLIYSHCLIQNYDLSTSGIGNMDGTDPGNDPLFYTADAEVVFTSPVINQGDNSATTVVEDLLGNHRIRNNVIDLGATEYQPTRIVHVDLNATGANNGKRWSDAYTDLRTALLADVDGDEYWVAEGIYYPSSTQSSFYFFISNAISIYGGFQGDELFRSERDPQAHRVILSGDIDQNDTINAQGVVTDPANIVGNNSKRLIFIGTNPESGSILIDGLTITGATGDTGGSLVYGGIVIGFSPGDVTLNRCIIRGNRGNSTGGVYVATGNLAMTSCQVWNNYSPNHGGGVYFSSDGELFLEDTVIQENESFEDGGGVWSRNSSLSSFQRCVFRGNKAGDQGGGMYVGSATQLQIDDSVFSSNLGGGAWFQFAADARILNCTFQGNHWITTNPSAGGALTVSDSTVEMTNTIIWGNALNNVTTSAEASVFFVNTTGTTQYSLLQNINPSGNSNLNGTNAVNTPLFVNGTNPLNAPLLNGDLRLQTNSPGIDDGNSASNTHITDLDGNARIFNTSIDLGAYEFGSSPPLNTFALLFPGIDPNGDENGNGYTNYLEYASGYNPMMLYNGYFPPRYQNGMITFQSRVGAIDVFQTWEKSISLKAGSWFPMVEGVDYVIDSTGGTPILQYETLQILLTPPSTSQLYIRQRFSSIDSTP